MEPVRIRLEVGGVSEVMAALRTVEQAMLRAEQGSTKATERGAQARLRGVRAEADAHVRATQQWAKQRERIIDNSARMAGRTASREAAQQVRTAERTAAQEARIIERATRDKIRAEERWARQREQIQTRSATMAARIASREVEQSQAAQRRFRSGVVNRAGGTLGRLASGAGTLAATAVTLGGGFIAADAVRERLRSKREIADISNAAFIPEVRDAKGNVVQKGQARGNQAEIEKRIREVSAQTNMSGADLRGGLRSYIEKSSDYSGGMANLGEFAKIAKASGSNFEEVIGAAGMLRAQNPDLDQEQSMNMLRSIVGQGKMGSISMADLAANASKVTASSAMYSGNQADAQRNLLGLSQIAVRTAGSPEEAATAVTRLGSDVLSHAGTLKKHGVNMSEIQDAKTGLLKDPAQVIGAIMEKSGGHLGKIGEMGMGERSIKLFEALAPTFQKAEAAKKGSGRAAVEAEITKMEHAGSSKEDIEKDFAAVMATSAEKFEGAINRLKELLADKLFPHLERLIDKMPEWEPKIAKALDAFGWLVDRIMDSPLITLGAVVTGAILKDIAAAQVAETVKRMLAGGGAPIPGGAGGGGTGKGGAVVAGALAGAATYALVRPGIDAGLTGQKGGQRRTGELLAMLKSGDPAQIAAAKAEVGQAQGDALLGNLAGQALTAGPAAIYSGITGEKNESNAQIEKTLAAREIVDSEAIKNAIRDAVVTGVTNGIAQANPANANRSGAPVPQRAVQ